MSGLGEQGYARKSNWGTIMGRHAGSSEDQFNAALDSLYNAALEPGSWLSFIDTLSKIVDARGGQYQLVNAVFGAVEFSVASAVHSPDAVRDYIGHWGAHDPRRALAMQWRDGKWMHCHEHFDEHYVARSEFYQDFLIPNGIRYTTGRQAASLGNTVGILGLHRAPGQPFFGSDEQKLLKRLDKHLERAARLHLEMARLKLRATMGEQALDALAYPVMLVDERGAVVLMNNAARTWLDDNGHVKVRVDCLMSRDPRMNEAIARMVRNACVGCVSGARTGGSMAVPKRKVASAYQLLCVPISPHMRLAAAWQRPLALLIVGDPEAKGALQVKDMQSLFDFTAAEARIALHLAEGESLEKIAETQGVSIHTVRSQLARALEKTGTRRQAELVKMVLALPRVKRE